MCISSICCSREHKNYCLELRTSRSGALHVHCLLLLHHEPMLSCAQRDASAAVHETTCAIMMRCTWGLACFSFSIQPSSATCDNCTAALHVICQWPRVLHENAFWSRARRPLQHAQCACGSQSQLQLRYLPAGSPELQTRWLLESLVPA